MATQQTTLPYSAPECECLKVWPGDILCYSPITPSGSHEDFTEEEW